MTNNFKVLRICIIFFLDEGNYDGAISDFFTNYNSNINGIRNICTYKIS